MGFWHINTIAICTKPVNGTVSSYQAWGIALSLAADVIPCVRFNYFVRLWFEPPR